MAKRFTDTNKYKKPFFRNLPGAYKLFWDFLYHDCDHSGIWQIDFEIAQKYVGDDMVIKREVALKLFNSDEVRVVEFDNGKKWFIVPFIAFQYGKLSEKNRAHVAVITALLKHELINSDLSIKNFPKPLISPLQGVKDKEMEKDMDKDKEKEQEPLGKSENPFLKKQVVYQMHDLWKATFPHYTEQLISDLPACREIAEFIFKTAGIKTGFGDVDAEVKMLNTFQAIADQVNKDKFWSNKGLHSISKHIQEFYNKLKNPKTNGTGTGKVKPINSASTREELNDLLNKRYAGVK